MPRHRPVGSCFSLANQRSDPLPFQWRAKEPSLCERVRFIDVDYEELLMSKCDIILATPKMKDLLTLDDLRPTEKGIVFHSDEYTAIGCDLRNTSRLGRLLNSVVPLEECVVLCVAEVSITYMPPDAADALLAWSSKLSSGNTFFSEFEWLHSDCGQMSHSASLSREAPIDLTIRSRQLCWRILRNLVHH